MSRMVDRDKLEAVRTEGGLLPADILQRIVANDREVPGLKPEDYHLDKKQPLAEAITRSWNRMLGLWAAFQTERAKLNESDPAQGVTRERFLLPLFEELGFGRLPKAAAGTFDVDGRSYPITHLYHCSPIHLVGAGVSLDRPTAGVAGAAKSSPHGLVQDFLNRSDAHLWAFLSNGLVLRVLRDHRSLTRQAFVELDLEAIFEGELFHAFRLLWLVCHQSRVEAERPENCWLEKWFELARDEGVRALEHLREGVESAIESLGAGFLAHPKNAQLKQALATGDLSSQDYYRELLRLVYRLIFLFVAEDRDVLLVPGSTREARDRYERFYATRRIRELARRRRGTAHGDLWQALRVVMNQLDTGSAALALPALGSFLWSADCLPNLDPCTLSNEHLLAALRHLSTFTDGKLRYAVNWRNVGSEELGSVYESLLELTPDLSKDAAHFELKTKPGHERKKTSSFYTSAPLVDCVLAVTLDPLLDEAERSANPEATLLGLRVCDPACGSGHFLVAAGWRVARRVARQRSGGEEPSPDALRHALRDVVGRCLYGVDLNPMAVELCKVSLWMEAVEPGKPLSFLDSHVLEGNALIGVTPELMRDGIPDVAFKELEGDDPEVAKRLRARNKTERRTGQTTLLALLARPADQSTTIHALETHPSEDREQLRAKETAWQQFLGSRHFQAARLVADAWCAAFFWPKETGDSEDAAPTQGAWAQWSAQPGACPEASKNIVTGLRERHGFFHWHLMFPQVFAERGGFDVMLGNPPWDTMSPDTKEFFSAFDPAVREQDAAGQRRIVEELVRDPAIRNQWQARRRDLYAEVHFLKQSKRYVMYAPGNLGKGDFNVYRMFVETALSRIRPNGAAGQVVPDGLYGGANAMAIRKALFEECSLSMILGFENTREIWFDGIDSRTKFCIYTARRPGTTDRFDAAFNVRTPEQLAAVLAGDRLSLPVSLVREFSPDALAVMEFANQKDIDIASRVYSRWPKFGDRESGQPYRQYMCELHMGNDRRLFSDGPTGLPLYEGRMVAQYDHRAKGYRSGRGRKAVWDDLSFEEPTKSVQPQWRIPENRIPDKCLDRCRRFRIGFCDVASPTNERSLVATIIPPDTLCGHKVPTITYLKEFEWAYLPTLAVFNSFSMDFIVRKKVGLTMSFTILDSLPLPRFADPTDQLVARLARPVLGLICTTKEFIPFWNAMTQYGWCARVPTDSPAPGEFDTEQRLELCAEIEAQVALGVFDLSRDELAYVLDHFTATKKYDEKKYGDYRSKLMILSAYDRLRSGTCG